MKVVLLGPPGVGKGTTGKILSEHFKLPHISTGQMFRDAIAAKSELGNQVKDIVESGGLVSDELVTAVTKERLSQDDAGNGFLLDGYPRTIQQAKDLSAFGEPTHVLNFVAPKKAVFDRWLGRIQNEDRGGDDTPDTMDKRWQEYLDNTEPLIDYYRNEGTLHDIDSTDTIEGVANQCKQILGDTNGNNE